jgi:hypothetical protein
MVMKLFQTSRHFHLDYETVGVVLRKGPKLVIGVFHRLLERGNKQRIRMTATAQK